MSVLRSAVLGARSFLGLYSLVMGALALVTLAVAFLLFVFLPDLQNTARVLLVLALVLLALFVVGAYSEVKASVVARQTRYGTNTGVMVTAFLGIAVLVNVIAAENHRRFDVTAGGQYTLARQTQTVLKNLKAPIKITGFFTKEPLYQAAQERTKNLLEEYRYQSDKIGFEFVDFEEKPEIARQFDARVKGTLVFESEGRRKQVFTTNEQDFTFSLTEQDVTGAILNVTGTVQPKIYFVTGHGERDINDNETPGPGFGLANQGLTADNYLVLTVDLSAVEKAPQDAALLVVAGPRRPFDQREIRLLNEYLDSGGKALFLLDPDPQPELKDVLSRWGVAVKDGTVVDLGFSLRSDPATPAVSRANGQYLFPPIARDLDRAVFPGAAGLEIKIPEDDRDHVSAVPLATTTLRSFLETNKEKISFDESEDSPGPFPLAMVVEANKPIGQRPQRPPSGPEGASAPEPKLTRLVVFADSDFATNMYFSSVSNGDLFLNSVNWLTAHEELISIRPKPSEFRPLVITQRAWDFILYSTIAFWPLAVLFAGGVVWWRRR